MITKVVNGDCREVAAELDRKFAMVFCDSPFNQGEEYDGWNDRLPVGEFQRFVTDYIRAGWNCVEKGGVLVVHGKIEMQPIVWRSIIELDLDLFFETQIVWHFRFGQHTRSNWTPGHAPAVVLRKGGAVRKFYPEQVLVESDRAKMGDKRVSETANGGTRPAFTVWGIPSDGAYWGRVTGKHSNKERRPLHENQLPEKLIERYLNGYTEEDDWVLDMFGGSGTVPTVAAAMGRNCVVIEQSAKYCDSIKERILQGAVRI